MAYKQDIDDYRESPAIRVIDEFRKVGAEVDFMIHGLLNIVNMERLKRDLGRSHLKL